MRDILEGVDPFCKPSAIFLLLLLIAFHGYFLATPGKARQHFIWKWGMTSIGRLHRTYDHLTIVVVEDGDLLSGEHGNG